MSLPYGMPPSPVLRRESALVDLGDYGDGSLTGFKVIFDLSAPVEINEFIGGIQDDSQSPVQRVRAMYDWITSVCVAWNFMVPGEGPDDPPVALPQPRAGGARKVPQSFLAAIAGAYAAVSAPSKNS